MDQSQDNTPKPKYWMSLEQWRQDPEFKALAEKEFMTSPLQSEEGQDGWARREFLKLMGASLALSSFGCVRRPAQKIIPYVNKPTEITHGIPDYYASSYVDGMEGLGILVTTRDGRPIKIEGNPTHSWNAGGMSARAHGDILKLYDPDRLTGPKHNLQNDTRSNRESIGIKWEDLDKAVIEKLKAGHVALLTSTCLSPSTQALMDEFASAFGVKTYTYDDLSYTDLMEAQQASYGQSALPRYHIDKAKYIVAVNNDFLGTWLAPVGYQKQYSKGRKAAEGMSKLVAYESLLSLTGVNADERYRIRPTQTLDVLMGLLHELIVNRKVSRYASDGSVQRVLAAFPKNSLPESLNLSQVAEELWKNRGQSLVLAGGVSAGTESAVEIQIAANFLNAVLENDGKTVEPVGATHVTSKSGSHGMKDLLAALKQKDVKTLIIHGCNPVYALPDSVDFAGAMKSVETIIATADRNDETAKYADYLAVDHHALENWGDMLAMDGTYSIQQPTIRPLYDTRAFQDSLLAWMKGAGKGSTRAKASASWYDYLYANWKENLARGGKKFEDEWVDILQAGVLENKAHASTAHGFSTSALSKIKPESSPSGFELALYTKVGIGDGRLANVPWLQELPDPVTKIVWDNYASLSLKDAVQMGLKEGSHVSLTVGDQTLTVPVHIQPGQADGVVGLALGYGRSAAGQVANGVGVRAVKLAKWAGNRLVTAGLPVAVAKATGHTDLACTQGHHTMEGRQIVVEETLKDHIKNPGGAVERIHIKSMWAKHKYPGHKWGMVIDLNTCTGCSSCVIACQSENNVPTVGKRYVLQGREMHWIRVDRYYVGTPEDPAVVLQPLPCMHCDNAPCETVCPVIATMHSEEGTNDMIYNRCVGTRYCANNCPYKVRRFNWFNYQNDMPKPHKMALNPEVTVRFRGVMEKCSLCIHRIKFGKMEAKLQNRAVKPNELQTACQQSCPTGAIVFGDLNNPESTVAMEFNAPQSYSLLEELNTQPAVHYQVKVRNVERLKGQQQSGEEGTHA